MICKRGREEGLEGEGWFYWVSYYVRERVGWGGLYRSFLRGV